MFVLHIDVFLVISRYCSDMYNVVSAIDATSHEKQKSIQWTPTKSILSVNQFFSLMDMKRKFINSDNHKFHPFLLSPDWDGWPLNFTITHFL
jgi:hypothetical protein